MLNPLEEGRDIIRLDEKRLVSYENKLLIVCGLSFVGKSTMGSAIAERFGHEQVAVDDTKDRLFGPNVKDEDLPQDERNRIYDETDAEMECYLQSGKSVVDASRNFRKMERDRARIVAGRAGARVVTIFVYTPEDIAHQRLLENRKNPSRRDWTDEEFQYIADIFEPPGRDQYPLVFRYGDELSSWITFNSAVFGSPQT